MKIIITLTITLSIFSTLSAQWNFSNSLHKTRSGIGLAYSAENGGMETITNIPIEDLACKKCHSYTGFYPNGNSIDSTNYTHSCVDCHNFEITLNVFEEACINCHQRQQKEREHYSGMDVHTNEGLNCISCHTKEELHGDDNITYSSLKESGAIKTKCTNCHTQLSNNASHNRHIATVDCSACHAVSVYNCAGCHFETYIETEKKRYNNEFKDYRLLIKKDGMVKLGALVTHSYNGKSNYIISSTHSHIIKKNATTCSDCHRGMGHINAAITEYNNTGYITLAKWDSTTKTVNILNGVIPIPSDWQRSLKVDHVTYTGDFSIFPSDPGLWELLKSETDNSHLYFAEPLDSSTMAKLGFTRFPTSIEPDSNIPIKYILDQNYPNPFNPSTNFKFSIPEESKVILKVYDMLGKEIETLVNEERPAGTYELTWNAAHQTSGVYFYRLEAGGYSQIRKMILLK